MWLVNWSVLFQASFIHTNLFLLILSESDFNFVSFEVTSQVFPTVNIESMNGIDLVVVTVVPTSSYIGILLKSLESGETFILLELSCARTQVHSNTQTYIFSGMCQGRHTSVQGMNLFKLVWMSNMQMSSDLCIDISAVKSTDEKWKLASVFNREKYAERINFWFREQVKLSILQLPMCSQGLTATKLSILTSNVLHDQSVYLW